MWRRGIGPVSVWNTVWISWTEDPRGYPVETSECQHVGPNSTQREGWSSRDVASVLNRKHRGPEWMEKNPTDGGLGRKMEEKQEMLHDGQPDGL